MAPVLCSMAPTVLGVELGAALGEFDGAEDGPRRAGRRAAGGRAGACCEDHDEGGQSREARQRRHGRLTSHSSGWFHGPRQVAKWVQRA